MIKLLSLLVIIIIVFTVGGIRFHSGEACVTKYPHFGGWQTYAQVQNVDLRWPEFTCY